MAGNVVVKTKKSLEKDLYPPEQTLLYKPIKKRVCSSSGKKVNLMKMKEVNLKVSRGKKYLVAMNKEMGIFTEGENWDILMKNIKEVIEAYFNIPSADAVKINLQIDPLVQVDA